MRKMKRIISLWLAVILVITGVDLPFGILEIQAAANVKRYTVLVLDTSDTAEFTYNNETIYTADTALSDVKSAAGKFIRDISATGGDNYVAVISYKDYATTVSGFSKEYSSLINKINNLSASSTTRDISSGLELANSMLNHADSENVIKNVVLFSTGMTNEGDYNYDGYYDGNVVGNAWHRNDTNVHLYAYANHTLEEADLLKDQGINLYSIGLFKTMANMPQEGKNIAEFFKMTASDIATSEDYFYPVYSVDDLEFTFGEVADDILSSVKEITFTYSGDSTAKCYYSDNYFAKSAYNYSPSLATMSLSFAMSAFGSSDGGQTDYTNKSSNARALLKEMGFADENIAVNDWFTKKPTTDSIGVIIGNKPVKVKDEEYTLIAVAVRGGGYEQEWASNFTIGTSGQHQGFNTAKNNVLSYLKQYISKQGISGQVKIWVTGYSRAAATANLVSGELDKGIALGNDISYQRKDVYGYCFETPAGALSEEVNGDSKYDNIFNIINQSDPVPYVAPAAMGFGRYGIDRYLPSAESEPKDYADLKKKMLAIYQAMPTTEKYVVDDFQMKKISVDNLTWNAVGFLKDGLIVNDTKHNYSQGVFLSDYVTILSKKFIVNRENYVDRYQNEIREICSVVFGCTDEQSGRLTDSIVSQVKSEWYKFVGAYIWNTGINPWGTEEKALKIVSGWLRKALQDAGITDYNELVIDYAGVKLSDLMLALVSNHPNYFTTAVLNGEGLGAAHYPELCYAWLASMDSNYVGTTANRLNNGGFRIIRINCEVDVKVFDAEQNKIASIINEQSDETGSYIAGVDNNGQKYVVLPVDETFYVEMTAREKDSVNYSINEYSALAGEYTRNINYFNIEMEKGEVVEGVLPAYDKAELEKDTPEGSDADYRLYDADGNTINSDSDLSGDDARNAYFTVEALVSDEKAGTVIGGGIYQYGQFAKFQAIPEEEYVFEGWYREGILLSKEEDYRIQILSDESITAKFVKKRTPKVVKLSKTKYVYDGKTKNPGVIVLDGDGNRVSSDHYTVSYQAGRKKVGQYHVNVKMKNKYCGSKTLSFKIVPKATKITKVIKKKKALSISWKKQKKQVSGYQIQVSTSRKFKSKKTKNISGMKKNSTTVSKLKSRKKYYIRIRTWKKKNRKKYYSAWSKVKIGKTK